MDGLQTRSPGRPIVEIALPGPEDTDRLGVRLAGALPRGTLLRLSGPLGAGKSALARSLIRARMGDPELAVPSPTFTLVNVFETPAGEEIWHADLYRLADPEETRELGLEDAIGRALVIVEWPDRMDSTGVASAMDIALHPEGAGRRATVTGMALPPEPGTRDTA